MPPHLITRNRVGLFALLTGLVCETAAAIPFFIVGVTWLGGQQAFILHGLAAVLTGLGAASVLTNREHPSRILGPAALFTLLAFAIPVAGLGAVLILTIILFSHRLQPVPTKSALTTIPEPGADTALPVIQPLVTTLNDLDTARLRAAVLGMDDMPCGQTRPLLARLQRHRDMRVRLYAGGLINDQTDADERRLASLEEQARSTPRDLSTLLAIVESYLRLIDEGLIHADELPHTAQRAVHAADAVLAIEPANSVALRAMTRFQLVLNDFHSAYGTILRLHQIDGQQHLATDLLARLSYEYATRLPAEAAPPSPPPQPKVPTRHS